MVNRKTPSCLLIALLAVSMLVPLAAAQTVSWYRVTFSADVGGTIKVTYSGVDHGPGTYTLYEGTPVTITAVPYEGYVFDYFSFTSAAGGSGSTTVNPISTTILSAFTITAHFRQVQTTKYLISLSSVTSGESNGVGNSATITYSGIYATVADTTSGSWWRLDQGIAFTVTANALSGYKFTGYTVNGQNYGTDPTLNLVATQDYSIVANFEEEVEEHNVLAVTVVSNGQIIESNAVGVDFGSGEQLVNEGAPGWWRVAPNTAATLSAYPTNGFEFVCWEINGVNSTDNPKSITVSSSYVSVKAYFNKIELPAYLLFVEIKTDVEVTGNCNVEFDYGYGLAYVYQGESATWVRLYEPKTIYLKAVPDTLWAFAYFDVEGQRYYNPQLSLNVNSTTSIKAWFYYLGPTPTPTPSGWNFDDEKFTLDLTLIVELVLAIVLTIAGVLILIKSTAWIPGVIIVMAGLIVFIIVLPNLYGLASFALTVLLSAVLGFKFRGPQGGSAR